MKLKIATAAALLVSIPASGHAHHAKGCSTKACDKRVGHKRAIVKKRAAVRPHNGFLYHLRMCESTNRQRATSPDGLYLGYYQFDRRTYASVGGTGDPRDDGLLEQSYRAVILYRRRGIAPWPVCGPKAA